MDEINILHQIDNLEISEGERDPDDEFNLRYIMTFLLNNKLSNDIKLLFYYIRSLNDNTIHHFNIESINISSTEIILDIVYRRYLK